jgi:hypothetical protein
MQRRRRRRRQYAIYMEGSNAQPNDLDKFAFR